MAVLKYWKLRPVASSTGTPSITGMMPFLGVQLGRDGGDDPLVEVSPDYRMGIPNANIVFFSAHTHDSVLALPLSACAIIPPPPPPPPALACPCCTDGAF